MKLTGIGNNRIVRLTTFGMIIFINSVALAEQGEEILRQRCVQCHALDGQDIKTLTALWEQNGPDLSSAGIKYKQQWIAQWLTAPTRVRPAGMFYGNHIKPGTEHDVIDDTTLTEHMKLNTEQAKAVAAALMKYQLKKELIQKGAYKSGTISLSSGDMLFVKFKGCLSCHRIEPTYGGVTGPEVYTVAKRLQEDYIISFLKDPQAWSYRTYMPQYHLKEADLQKFVHYFHALAKEGKQ